MDKENPKPKTILETLIEMNRSYSSSGMASIDTSSIDFTGNHKHCVYTMENNQFVTYYHGVRNVDDLSTTDKWVKYVNLFEKMVFNALPGMCLVEKNNVSRKYKDAEEEIYIEYRFKGDPSRQYCQVTYTDEGVVVFQKRKQTPKKIYKSFTKFLENSDYI